MIIKGQAVKGASRLSRHLLSNENELVRVLEVQGLDTTPTPDNFTSTLKDMEAMGRITQSRTGRVLYHANIDPKQHERLTDQQYLKAADQLMENLGLSDQPRVVVQHIKKGRQHAHVVVQLTDIERRVVKRLDNNYYAQSRTARELERAFNLEHTPQQKTGNAYTQKDHQQAKKRGLDITDYRQMVQDAYIQSTNGEQFAKHLEQRGYVLAKGDRRGMVVVGPEGSPRSLTRDLKPIAKAREVKEKCADIVPHLPDVSTAQKQTKHIASEKKKERQPQPSNDNRAVQQKDPIADLRKNWGLER